MAAARGATCDGLAHASRHHNCVSRVHLYRNNTFPETRSCPETACAALVLASAARAVGVSCVCHKPLQRFCATLLFLTLNPNPYPKP